MGNWSIARRLATIIVTGTVAAGTAHAQNRANNPAALNAVMVSLQQAGKYAEATEVAKRVLAITEKARKPAHRDLGSALNNLAELYRVQNRYGEAEPLFKRSLTIREKVLGQEHRDVGMTLNDLASLYRDQGRYGEAAPLYRRSLVIREKAGGPEHRDVGTTLNNLGELYREQGRYGEAEPILKRSLTIAEKMVGSEHSDVAAALNNLGALYCDQGRYGEAEPLYKQALQIREKALPAGHPDIATSLNNLGDLLVVQGRHKQAEPLLTRALEMREKALPTAHRDIASTLNNLSSVYWAKGQLNDAERLGKRVLAIRETVLPEGHPEIARSLEILANRDYAQGRLTEFEQLHKRALAMREAALPEGHPDIATSLINLGFLYSEQGRQAETELLYKRALAIYEKALPEAHPYIAATVNSLISVYLNQHRFMEAEPLRKRAVAIYSSTSDLEELAALYQKYGRYAEGEPLLKRALALAEQRFDANPQEVANHLTKLAIFYVNLGRLTEPEPLLKRALEMREKVLSPDHPVIAQSLNNLASFYDEQGRLAEAEPLHKRALEIWEKAMPAGHPDIALGLNNLASLYVSQGRLAEAEPLLKRALNINEKAQPPDHGAVARSLDHLANLYERHGRYTESEVLIKRALEMREKALPVDHPDIARSLSSLASHHQHQGRFPEAALLRKRVLEIRQKTLPADHPDIAESFNNLATVSADATDAETLYRRALEIWEKTLPAGHPSIANALSNLGYFYQHSRPKEAERLHKRALEMREKALPAGHPDIALSLQNLASGYMQQGRLAEAEPLYERALDIREKTLPAGHPYIGSLLVDVGMLALARKDWPRALAFARRGTAIFIARGTSELRTASNVFRHYVLAAHRTDGSDPRLRAESFQMAQGAQQSEAAAALTQMAARQAKGEGSLAGLVRESQDLGRRARAVDQLLIGALGRGEATLANVARLEIASLEGRLKAIDQRLASEFSEYSSFANPQPLSIAEAQALLGPDETMLVFLETRALGVPGIPVESFVWGLTKTDARWIKLPLPPGVIDEHVQALRCGLDHALWNGGESEDKCVKLVKARRFDGMGFVGALPFDLERAHQLYQALLGPFEDLIKDKHLLIVPSGPLTTLPFSTLVVEPPKTRIAHNPVEYRDATWLGVRQPITVLPSVPSLKALRAHAKTSQATKAYLGVGNPLLDGPGDEYSKQAEAARAWQHCSTAPGRGQAVASARGRRLIPGLKSLFRGQHANIEYVRQQTPLPETADELCQIARGLGVPESEILLGSQATETTVKDFSEKGRLADYRIVHFATHGALAGELKGLSEPGLILTPPPSGTSDVKALEHDDGYLTASEVATLKLDADWVILSACNTAGAASESAEALSGLARAFFYAGARTLLVSHWAVDSDAAVKLTTRAFHDLKANPIIGRAEAFRMSMRELIHNGSLIDAHPMQWAAFAVVGEGAR